MRLVSALYPEFYPFNEMGVFDDFVVAHELGDLQAGDVLLLWGGEDVSPQYYKHQFSRYSGAERHNWRDAFEWELMNRAKELGVPIVGICRGAQFLCAFAGGTLVQHVNNHGGNHTVITADNEMFIANSLHHQMMHPGDVPHELLAWTAPRGDAYYVCPEDGVERRFTKDETDKDPECVYFPEIKGLAVQWHPEMMKFPTEATSYVFKKVNEKLLEQKNG
jgi:putative glutamine amidotransferase